MRRSSRSRLGTWGLAGRLARFPVGVRASHDGTCHPEGPSAGEGWSDWHAIVLTTSPDHAAPGGIRSPVNVSVLVDPEGHAGVSGFVPLPSEKRRPPRLLRAESGTVQCADVDGDGSSGLARVEIACLDVRSGEAVSALITPDDGDIATPGSFAGTIVFPGLDVSGPVRIRIVPARRA